MAASSTPTPSTSSSTPPRILLTGATGFIGGSVLTALLASTTPALRNATITCILRGGPERVAKLTSAYAGDTRLRAIVYGGLDDEEATTAAAAQHDVVIGTTFGFHTASALALLAGLAQRKAATGRDVWMIHTSGTSNLADRHITGPYTEEREFDDARDDVYGHEKELEARGPSYLQRRTELAVIDAGLELGVKTVVLMSPTIFGRGTGSFNRTSVQIPAYIKSALANGGRAVVVGDGRGVWDHVHVEDLADLYRILVEEALGGGRLPTGKRGILFSGNGRHAWREVAQAVADLCCGGNLESVGLAEGAAMLAPWLYEGADATGVELGLCSNARTVASVARSLGWKPTRGEELWMQGFRYDTDAVKETWANQGRS